MNANSIILHSTPTQELRALIADAVAEQLKVFMTPQKEPDNKLYTRTETAKMLGVSLPTLHEWTKNGTIQGVRIGSRVRYRMADINAALEVVHHVKCKRHQP